MPAPAPLGELAECLWFSEGGGAARILPDGCMDLIDLDGDLVVAGPDTQAHISHQRLPVASGIRFRPGALPRLLSIPANELRGERVPLRSVRPEITGGSLTGVVSQLLVREPTSETAPWDSAQLAHVTRRFAAGAAVAAVADEIGLSPRNLQRRSTRIYGYSPATLRRILRFRRAVRLLRGGMPAAETAALLGYSDQSHLSRQVRELAGVSAGQLVSTANRSTDVPSGSTTVA